MLKEEKELRKYGRDRYSTPEQRESCALITALIRAVREDCEKIYLKQECEEPDPYKIAAAIRKGKR